MLRRRSGRSQQPIWRSGGLLARLARDIAGNTLAIMAAALIPLTAMIGSGVDMSRAYLAQNRLQQACDAAALAGRRVMTTGTADAAVTAEATKFFNFNFPQGKYQTAAFTPSISASGGNTVIVTASTTIPTAIMKIFGKRTLPISATCNARQDYVNTDVVLVLDNTGSMNCAPGADASCSSSYEVSGSKMQGMRDAVMALYDALTPAQTQLQAAGLRLRYGIVPFSSTVNVGKLVYGLSHQYINSKSNYEQCSSTDRYGNCTAYSPTAVNHPASWLNSSNWSGCIEEAGTNSSITTASGMSIPSDANDLNVDLVPQNGSSAAAQKTQWAVFDTTAEQADTWGSSPCPTQAVALQAFTRSNLLTYMNSLSAGGGTMTDVGMVWGGRMLSRAGIWSSLNPITYNSMPINQYIILMTDGGITAYASYYGAYGVENYDHRADGTPYPCGSQSSGECVADSQIHRQRFSMICNEIRGEGVSIWAIGFGQSFSGGSDPSGDTQALSGCASNSNQVAYITDSQSLIDKFTQIGNQIGSLRITQ